MAFKVLLTPFWGVKRRKNLGIPKFWRGSITVLGVPVASLAPPCVWAFTVFSLDKKSLSGTVKMDWRSFKEHYCVFRANNLTFLKLTTKKPFFPDFIEFKLIVCSKFFKHKIIRTCGKIPFWEILLADFLRILLFLGRTLRKEIPNFL